MPSSWPLETSNLAIQHAYIWYILPCNMSQSSPPIILFKLFLIIISIYFSVCISGDLEGSWAKVTQPRHAKTFYDEDDSSEVNIIYVSS